MCEYKNKVVYYAVFYSGGKVIDMGKKRLTHEEAEKDIEKVNEDYSMFHYTPWDHAEVEYITSSKFKMD